MSKIFAPGTKVQVGKEFTQEIRTMGWVYTVVRHESDEGVMGGRYVVRDKDGVERGFMEHLLEEVNEGSMIVTVELDRTALVALDTLLEEDDWADAGEAVSEALKALAEARADLPEALPERGVHRVLSDYATGELSWDEAFAELSSYVYTESMWKQVRTAHTNGWITSAQFWQLWYKVDVSA